MISNTESYFVTVLLASEIYVGYITPSEQRSTLSRIPPRNSPRPSNHLH